MLIAFRFVIVYLVTIFPFDECAQKKYHNYTLYRAIPMSEKHLKFFKDLTSFYDVNYWRPPGKVSKSVEFIISPEDRSAFTKDAEHLGIYLVTIMDNVQRAFDGQTVRSYIRRKMEQFDWRSYFKTNDIYKWLFDLGNEYPQEVYLESIGKTLENRDIIAVRILLGTGKRRPKVIVEGGIHAREWISPAFVTYMMNQILHAPKSNNTILKEIAFAYEWYFVPILNPDGYEITHTSDRLWRKNSRGVDLNRNFGIAFGTVGVSFSSWDNSYCGDHAFSERESSSMASFVRSKSEDLEYYLAFHSYGQYMIIPYTFTKKHLENYDEMYAMGKKAALRIADKHGTGYSVGTAFDTVGYLTSGVSGCWVKKTFKVPYVLTFELRDEGYYGFALPPADILPTCEETMDGVLSLLSPTQRKLSQGKSGQGYNILDRLVTAWNIILFIIVRYVNYFELESRRAPKYALVSGQPVSRLIQAIYAWMIQSVASLHCANSRDNNSSFSRLHLEFPDLTLPPGFPRVIKNTTVHHIITTNGPPVACRPRRLAPHRLVAAKKEFEDILNYHD